MLTFHSIGLHSLLSNTIKKQYFSILMPLIPCLIVSVQEGSEKGLSLRWETRRSVPISYMFIRARSDRTNTERHPKT